MLNRVILAKTAVPVSSKHDVILDQVAEWYSECLGNHAQCRDFPDLVAPVNLRPSRLLDVSEPNIRLDCSVTKAAAPAGTRLQYTTLSHMWGLDASQYLTLTRSNLASFQSSIPFDILPRKYVDAIRITRRLGFRYIWIDSLCIVQDDAADWEREALRMAAVYGRSALNITYTTPPEKEDGVASAKGHLRDPRIDLPCVLGPPWPPSATQPRPWSRTTRGSIAIQHAPGRLSSFFSPSTHASLWPVLSRGWVFQERALCARTVYYGGSVRRLQWECCAAALDEFYGDLAVAVLPRSKRHMHGLFAGNEAMGEMEITQTWQNEAAVDETGEAERRDQIKARGRFTSEWHTLISQYRAGRLTRESDRAIAFAGVARAVLRRISASGDTGTGSDDAGNGIADDAGKIKSKAHETMPLYLAGLWRHMVALDLLWSVDVPSTSVAEWRRRRIGGNPYEDVAAPSWSWFAVPVLDHGGSGTPSAAGQEMRDILDFSIRAQMATYWHHFNLYKAEVVRVRHPRLQQHAPSSSGGTTVGVAGEDDATTGLLLHDFAGLTITLRTRSVPCTFRRDNKAGTVRILPFGRPLPAPDKGGGQQYSHDEAHEEQLPPEGSTRMLLTVLQAFYPGLYYDYSYRIDPKKYEEREGVPIRSTTWQYAGIVVVRADQQRWRRVGVFILSGRMSGKAVVSTLFDDEAAEEGEYELV